MNRQVLAERRDGPRRRDGHPAARREPARRAAGEDRGRRAGRAAGRAAARRSAASPRTTPAARIARQASREDRLKLATHVIDNSGTIDDLEPQVDALWAELQALPQLPPDWDFPPRPRDDAAVRRSEDVGERRRHRASSVRSQDEAGDDLAVVDLAGRRRSRGRGRTARARRARRPSSSCSAA